MNLFSFSFFRSPARAERQRQRLEQLLTNDLESLVRENADLLLQVRELESANQILRLEQEELLAVVERNRQRVLAETQVHASRLVATERAALPHARETAQLQAAAARFASIDAD